ncbi:MAG: endonuclease/exonuclease/phosphatase family protein [Candidatus Thorarchaeota archaeon]|jgi:hypothetical protein
MTHYYFVAWWNVENLYSVMKWEDRFRKVRSVGTLKNNLKDWTEDVLDKKLEQLKKVIEAMNGGRGPDILGVGEVENKKVLDQLVDKLDPSHRKYQVVHHDSPDPRGIDVAFIYKKRRLDPFPKDPDADPAESSDWRHWFTHEVVKRSPTRDIFQVNFCPKNNRSRPFILIGNHWSSRLSGTYETEPYRILAAETLAYFGERIQEEYAQFHDNKQVPILAMGDFNDQPGDRSLTQYARSSYNRMQVKKATSIRFYNLMWPLMSTDQMSYWHSKSGPLFFDQFMVSKGFLHEDSNITVMEGSVKIEGTKIMNDKKSKSYVKPYRFGWKPETPLGFSDHFPISLKIKVKS